MIKPRAPKDWEFPDIVKFLDSNLRPNEDWSITSEYPLAFDVENRPNIRILEEQGEILAHAVTKYSLIKTKLGLFKTGGIGSVVTHPKYRGKGYSKSILNSCLEHAKNEKCDFVILWTDLFDFYRQQGFELAGQENSFLIDKPLASNVSQLKILETPKVAPESILRLYNRHTVGNIRTALDIQKFLQIPQARVFTAWDQNNQLVAYAVEGRGADLHGFVHEWGGGVEEILFLLSHIQNNYEKGITLISPKHSQNLNSRLIKNGCSHHGGYLGMIKLIHPKQIFIKLTRLARALGHEKFLIEELPNQKYQIQLNNDTLEIGDEKELVQLLFGPHSTRGFDRVSQESAQILNQLLPIPMWIWGWDSV